MVMSRLKYNGLTKKWHHEVSIVGPFRLIIGCLHPRGAIFYHKSHAFQKTN